jgi:hypothetical protein
MAVADHPNCEHIMAMKPILPADDKLRDTGGAPERGYADWKRAKIERGLEQAKDRTKMIPAEQVLRDFAPER